MQKFNKCAAVAAMVAGSGLGLAGTASADVVLDQPLGVGQCSPNTSQTCPQEPRVDYSTPGSGEIQAHFTANPGHCSDIEVRMVGDNTVYKSGYPISEWKRIGPGQTADSAKSSVAGGPHFVSVQARGVEGGCNTGHLDAWGGALRVDFTPDAGPIGQPDVPQFQLPDLGFPGPPDGLDVN